MKTEKENKRSRRSLFKKAAVGVVGLLLAAVPLAACSNKPKTPETDYNYKYEKPFSQECDGFMKIDGVLNEDVWKNQNKMVHTTDDVTLTATTVFTEKGLYVGMQALDKNIQWYLRSAFDSNSSFEVWIVKEGEPTYNVNANWMQHPNRNNSISIDAKTSRSYRETPYLAASKVEGEINSGNTESITAELFMTWEDLNYTQEELGENGYPETVPLAIQYRKVVSEGSADNLWIVPSFMQTHRYDTYFKFGDKGLKTIYSSEVLGNANGGVSASDRWEIDDEAGIAETSVDRTQVLWFKDAYATDFILEADITVDMPTAGYYPLVGLISYASSRSLNIYGYRGRELLENNRLELRVGRKSDGLQWLGDRTLTQTVQTGINSDTVRLRMIKRGGEFYYFYDGKYWDSEYIESLTGKTYAGFYANDGAMYSNYSFTDYSDKRDELSEILSQSIYFVNVPGVTARGRVSADKLSVGKGKPLTLNIAANPGYFLTGIADNGNDIYADVKANMADGYYTFTPDCDVNITATYSPLPQESMVDVLIPLKNEKGGAVLAASYVIKGNDNLVYYFGTANSQGNIVIKLPKAGSYEADGKSVTVDGNYNVEISAEGYNDAQSSFTLNDETASVGINGKPQSVKTDKAFTKEIIVTPVRYGTVVVNGVSVGGQGTLKYNQATENYYCEALAERYWIDSVSAEYAVTSTMKFTDMVNANTDPVAGLSLTAGSSAIVLKSCRWEAGRLCIAIGKNPMNTYEIAVSGFNHNIGANEGELKITAVKLGEVIYVLDGDGTLKVYLDKDGVHFVNGAAVIKGESYLNTFKNDLVKFFAAGKENAIGMIRYGSTGKVEWDAEFDFENVEAYVSGGAFVFDTETDEYTAVVSGLKAGDGYAKDSRITVEITCTDDTRAAKTLTLTYDGGSKNIEGVYNILTGVTVFEFEFDKTYAAEISAYDTLITLTGTVSGEGVNLENTVIELENGGKLTGAVSADGEYSIKLIAGNYNIRYSADGKTAYVLDKTVSAGTTADVTLTDNKTELGATGKVNGRTVTPSVNADKSFTKRAQSLSGAIADMGAGKLNILPNTVTAENYIYTVKMTDVNAFAGIGITNGKHILSFQVVSWESGGQNLVLELDEISFNRNTVEIEMPDSPNANACAVYTVIRYSDRIELYAGEGNERVLLLTATADGYSLCANARIKQRTANTFTSDQRLTMQQYILPDFFGEGVEHMAVFYRNDVNNSAGSYEYSFAELKDETLNGNVAFGNGATDQTATVTFTDTRYGLKYVKTVGAGDFTVKMPYGTYDYTVTSSDYATVTDTVTFDADSEVLRISLDYVVRVAVETYETESEIVFTWSETEGISDYALVRTGTNETVVASTESGLTATQGKYTVTVDKTDAGYAVGAVYELRPTPEEGIRTENVSFEAVEFGYGMIIDIVSADMAKRVKVDGAVASFDGGLKLTASGEATASVTVLRSVDLSDANYVSIVVAGSGEATVAGKTVTLTANGVYVPLTPTEYNNGEFDITFTDSVTIRKIEVDALDLNTKASWQNDNKYGRIERNENGSYSLYNNDAGGRYHFTALSMPKSTKFTVSVKVTSEALVNGQVGFAITNPTDGMAKGIIGWNATGDTVGIISFNPNVDQTTILKNGTGWLMSDADYGAINKNDFELTLVRNDNLFWLFVDGKLLVKVDADVIPLFVASESDKTPVALKDVPLAVGFGVRGVIAGPTGTPSIDRKVTFSDWSVSEFKDETLNGTVTFGNGATDKTATVTFTDTRLGAKYVRTVGAGDFTLDMPYGTYDYTVTSSDYETVTGSVTFNADSEVLSISLVYVLRVSVETYETDGEIVFTWLEASGISGYSLVRTGANEAVIASTGSGLTATQGKYVVTVDKTDGYVAGAVYELRITPEAGVKTENVSFTAVEFGYGMIIDVNSDDMAKRVKVEGAEASYDGGLKLSASGEATASVTVLRSVDLSKASYVSVIVAGSGEATVAGKTVTLSGSGVYVPLTPTEYNDGEFDVTFTDSVTIKKIEVDALDMNTRTRWNDNNTYGRIERNEDGSYSLYNNDASGRYHFTALSMPKSTKFTVSVKVKSDDLTDGQVGFAVINPADGMARGIIGLNTYRNSLGIKSFNPEADQVTFNAAGGSGVGKWLMSGTDYSAIDKKDFEMKLVRDGNIFLLFLDGKLLVKIDTDTSPLFIKSSTDKTSVALKDVPLAVGFGVRGVIQGSAPAIDRKVTFSDWSVSTEVDETLFQN